MSFDIEIQMNKQILNDIAKFRTFLKMKYPDYIVPDLTFDEVESEIKSNISNCELGKQLSQKL